MFFGRDFDPSDVGESEYFTLDFINDLPEGQTISAVQSVTLTVMQGDDSDPSSHLIGAAIINDSTQVMQLIRGLAAGNIYKLQVFVVTSTGLVQSGFAHIPCEAVL